LVARSSRYFASFSGSGAVQASQHFPFGNPVFDQWHCDPVQCSKPFTALAARSYSESLSPEVTSRMKARESSSSNSYQAAWKKRRR
jgi:hypothetical protein